MFAHPFGALLKSNKAKHGLCLCLQPNCTCPVYCIDLFLSLSRGVFKRVRDKNILVSRVKFTFTNVVIDKNLKLLKLPFNTLIQIDL